MIKSSVSQARQLLQKGAFFSNYDNWLTRHYEEDEPTLAELEERAQREEQRGFDQFEAEHQGDYDYA